MLQCRCKIEAECAMDTSLPRLETALTNADTITKTFSQMESKALNFYIRLSSM